MAKKKGPAPPEGGTVDLRALTESMRQRRLYNGRLQLEQQRADAEQQQAQALRDIADALARGAQLPAPAAGEGEVDPEYQPIGQFPVKVKERVEKAALPSRKSKRVRKKKHADGTWLYSAADARQWWPHEMARGI